MQTLIDFLCAIWVFGLIFLATLAGGMLIDWWFDRMDPFKFPRE